MTSKCVICQSSFRKYWTIANSCLHNFHYKCIQILIEHQTDQKVFCPICREVITGYRVVYKGKYRRYYMINHSDNKHTKQIVIDDYYSIKISNNQINESNQNLTRNQKKLRRRRQLKRQHKAIRKQTHHTNKSFNQFIKRHS